jgi:hypothetical protein
MCFVFASHRSFIHFHCSVETKKASVAYSNVCVTSFSTLCLHFLRLRRMNELQVTVKISENRSRFLRITTLESRWNSFRVLTSISRGFVRTAIIAQPGQDISQILLKQTSLISTKKGATRPNFRQFNTPSNSF